MKIKTAELTGIALDWALAKALGAKKLIANYKGVWVDDEGFMVGNDRRGWIAHTDPATCLGFIEKHLIDVTYEPRHKDCPMWVARIPRWGLNYGITPSEAVARCVVAMRLGDEVDVPSELVGEKS